MKEITSIQNPLIKQLVQLKDKSRERKKTGLFLIEGVREVLLAIKGGYELETVLFNDELIYETDLSKLSIQSEHQPEIISISFDNRISLDEAPT